ncbi:peptidase T (tripeptidase) [Carnobacterium maltaromaticum]|uniref:peptidase T n=1 Tax=Carnobacterium maltaromaticum TaxID=2751 RepID=UPI00191BA705|nr:peptidase T [Carnobacterium maltaromaticum]CAD5898275.1 peptidase T (tripeptidase) [Carnobacterium maltaromaticum]
MYSDLVQRFMTYVKKETRSDPTSSTVPTTTSQTDFAKDLVVELTNLGLRDVQLNVKNGFVTATLPSTTSNKVPTIGFIAHIDTADFNAVNIQPQIHPNYDGKELILHSDLDIKLKPTDFPNLKNYIGETLITTDGTTLLGADDKAGIAEIVTAIDYFIQNPEIEHGMIKVAFGPDEEIGRGADLFDVVNFGADFAYTIDSGTVGRLEYETFNAAEAKIVIKGKSVHPGVAKNTLINALKIALEFDAALPQNEVPERTAGYEGFYLLNNLSGDVEDAQLTYIIRDHDQQKFSERKQFFENLVDRMNLDLGYEAISLVLKDQYYNMGEIIQKKPEIIQLAIEAMKNIGIKAIVEPFRGGTDGSKISYLGLPCPNLFTGGENFHGRYEFISVESMEKATATIIEISQLNVTKNKNSQL